MRIQARQCPFTRAVFLEEDRDRYIEHLRSLREDMREKREQKRASQAWETWFEQERMKVTDIAELAPWFLKNQRFIMKAYNAINDPLHDGYKFYPGDEFTQLSIGGQFSPSCSNTHCCPHNGVTNWGGRTPGAPRGYPGFRGRVSGVLTRKRYKSSYPASDLLGFVGIHTGTGGGGNESWSYDVTVFEADWPAITQGVLVDKIKRSN